MKRFISGVALGCLLNAMSYGQEVHGCGDLRNHYGPFDYTNPVARRDLLPIVEGAHFTPQVAALVRGQSGDHPISDIDYTLRAFPNHHGALSSVSRYALNGGRRWSNPDVQSAHCYFRRAIVFAPHDAAVRILYGNYLLKSGNEADARKEYEQALSLAPESADIAYNAGLFFVEIGDLDRARSLAKLAYEKGYPLPGLRTRIEEAERAATKAIDFSSR
jgi:hypothetical protein